MLAQAAASTRAKALVDSMVAGRGQNTARIALKEIALYPVPYYRAARVTPRIHAEGLNITNVPTQLRQLLTRMCKWVELDLAQSQIAVNARRWHVEEVQTLLGRADFAFWDDLMVHLGVNLSALGKEDYELFKGILKESVYGVVYGMGKRRIRQFGHKGGIPVDVAEVVARACGRPADVVGARIMSHRVVKPMLAARRVYFERIKAEGGMRDAFNRGLRLQANQNPGALLAIDAQAIELRLLEPVIDAAIHERDSGSRSFSIVVWQHDGFSIAVRDQARKQGWVDRLQRLVAERAERVDIATMLVPKVGLSEQKSI